MEIPEVQAAVQSMWRTHTRNHPQAAVAQSKRQTKLLTAAELLRLPPMSWIVKGLLPARGLAVIYGQSGSGKSFLSMDLACATAAGSPKWFGARVKTAPVAYVVLEGASGFSQRLKAWQLHHRTPAPPNIRFIIGGFTLLDPIHAAQLALEIKEALGPGALVVIDTLNQSAPGADENSSVDMGRVISNAKVLAEAVDGLVVLVHHSGKDNTKGMRGHSSLHAATDAVIEVVSSVAGRAWRVMKVKDGEIGVPHGFELVPYVVGQDEDGDDLRSCAVRQTLIGIAKIRPPSGRNQKAALTTLSALAAAHSDGIPYEDAKRSVAGLMNCAPGRSNTVAKGTIDSLIESGHLELEGGLIQIHEQ